MLPILNAISWQIVHKNYGIAFQYYFENLLVGVYQHQGNSKNWIKELKIKELNSSKLRY